MKKLLKFVTSLKFSFVLLVLLFVVIVQRAIIAQRYFLSPDPEQVPFIIRGFDYLGLSSIQLLNQIFWGILFALVVSLGFSISRMIKSGKARRKGFARFKNAGMIQKLGNTYELNVSENHPEKIKDFFERKGFKVFEKDLPGTNRFFSVKHDVGHWGIVVFHLTFILFFLGGIASFLTRFTGYLELAPGEIFVEKFENYIQKTPRPFLFNTDNEFTLTLEKINLSYWKPGEIKQRAAVLSIADKMGNHLGLEQVSVNNPYKIENVKVYQGSRHGLIAGLTVSDKERNTAYGVIRFLLGKPKGPELITWIRLPGTTLDLKLELYSDLIRKIEGLENFYTSNFTGSLMKVSSIEKGGELQYHGVVFGGGTIEFEGLELKFDSLKPFTSFIITRDYGVPLIYFGFVFLLLSLIITYFWVPERYWITIQKEDTRWRVYIGASTERYKESFKERFSRLMNEFQGEVAR